MNKKRKVSITTTCRKEYKIAVNEKYHDQYWDEGMHYVITYAYRWSKKYWKKQLLQYQVRMYRTCKYNRKTQWYTNKS